MDDDAHRSLPAISPIITSEQTRTLGDLRNRVERVHEKIARRKADVEEEEVALKSSVEQLESAQRRLGAMDQEHLEISGRNSKLDAQAVKIKVDITEHDEKLLRSAFARSISSVVDKARAPPKLTEDGSGSSVLVFWTTVVWNGQRSLHRRLARGTARGAAGAAEASDEGAQQNEATFRLDEGSSFESLLADACRYWGLDTGKMELWHPTEFKKFGHKESNLSVAQELGRLANPQAPIELRPLTHDALDVEMRSREDHAARQNLEVNEVRRRYLNHKIEEMEKVRRPRRHVTAM